MASEPARKYEDAPDEANDSPEVAALRKKIRGQPLSETERATLEATYRKPPPGTVTFSQEQVTALLSERRGDG
jgi:hypothetical protein